jgi:putative ABC transport system ATP-binding protein
MTMTAPILPIPATALEWAVRSHGVLKSFNEGSATTPVLRGTDFAARRGEMMLLVGPSGCGKTTLLSIVAGTLNADGGEIEVMGERIDQMSSGQVTRFRSKKLGFVFQQFNLIPTVSVVENVSVPLLIAGMSSGKAQQRAKTILERVGLGDKCNARPTKLSGGQQQRVAIARALVHDPPLVLCDEPTSALDSENGRAVMDILRSIARDPGRCVIIVTHDNRTYRYADRMAEMEDGKIRRVLNSAAEIAEAHPPAMH